MHQLQNKNTPTAIPTPSLGIAGSFRQLGSHIAALGPIKLGIGFVLLLVLSFCIVKWVPFFHHSDTAPNTDTTSQKTEDTTSKRGDTTKPDDTSKSPEQTKKDSKTSNSSSASSGAGSASNGGGSSGTNTSTPPVNECSGNANHVAGGRDGTGSCWPGPDNTGVPPGTTLTNYSGPCVISTDGTVIDSKTINCAISVQAANVVIKNSKVNGNVILDTDRVDSSSWSLTIQDSEVDAGTVQESAIGWGNLKVIRVNVYGGVTAIQCEEKSVSCIVQDSYLHGQYIQPNSNWHLGGFLSDGGGPITLTHNYVVCDQQAVYGSDGGCTGDINLIPNFATAHDVTINHNLLGANIHSAFCTYGGDRHDGLGFPYGNHIVYTDNVFQRGSNNLCAGYGPVAGYGVGNPGNVGNVWTGNVWDNGGVVDPAY